MSYSPEVSMETFLATFIVCIILALILSQPVIGFLGLPIALFTMYIRDSIGDNKIN